MSLDDHMVYAAWMRQAMEGSFFFDNRFASLESQPGLTVNLYFFMLGVIAKLLGITLTLTLARVIFSYVLCLLLSRMIALLDLEVRTAKIALVLSVFGGGLAWMSWQTFGDKIEKGPEWFSSMMSGMQSIDNWQPEGFVFPSMLTNGLFLAAACLILVTLISIIKCRESWKPVFPGAIAFFLLMNIHSYDVLLVALVLIAFLVACAFNKLVTKAWLLRAGVICAAAIPPALWFVYTLKSDPVFQARAATPTFSAHPGQLGIGLALLAMLAFASPRATPETQHRSTLGIATLVSLAFFGLLLFPLFDRQIMDVSGWIVLYVLFWVPVLFLASKNIALNLLWSWACVSLIAPYFPALFQRKLTMLIAVPWAILAAIGIVALTKNINKPTGPLVQTLCAVLCCLSSILWLKRDLLLGASGVSRTLVHSLYLDQDETQIVEILNKEGYGKDVLCLPGVMIGNLGSPPVFNDLNPVLSGLTGTYSYAGHWSETPEYNYRRDEATQFFFRPWTEKQRRMFLRTLKTDYIVVPLPSAYPNQNLADLSPFGESIFTGKRLQLIRVTPN